MCNKLEKLRNEKTMRIPRPAKSLLLILIVSGTAAAGKFRDSEVAYPANNSKPAQSEKCSLNSDVRYDRDQILGELATILDDLFPDYKSFEKYRKDFFVQDLTDISNNYRVGKKNCINFINEHIYYFAPISFEKAAPHIAILQNGDLKVFKNIDCRNSGDKLSDVVKYLDTNLKPSSNKKDILTRVANYRRYGFYMMFDGPNEYCSSYDRPIPRIPTEEDLRTVGGLEKFAATLHSSIRKAGQKFYPGFFVERGLANGFFVYDLTDPTNKQTSLLESVSLLKGHVYHFAAIDLPWSFSFIAVAGESESDTKIFRAINCKSRGDKLSDVLDDLSTNLPDTAEKKNILDRVKNYRSYGVYAAFDGRSEPRCNDYAEMKP